MNTPFINAPMWNHWTFSQNVMPVHLISLKKRGFLRTIFTKDFLNTKGDQWWLWKIFGKFSSWKIIFKRTGEKFSNPFCPKAAHLWMMSHPKSAGFAIHSGTAGRSAMESPLRCSPVQLPRVPSHRAGLHSMAQIELRIESIMDSLLQFKRFFYEKEGTHFSQRNGFLLYTGKLILFLLILHAFSQQ